jgi:hypothetical protein
VINNSTMREGRFSRLDAERGAQRAAPGVRRAIEQADLGALRFLFAENRHAHLAAGNVAAGFSSDDFAVCLLRLARSTEGPCFLSGAAACWPQRNSEAREWFEDALVLAEQLGLGLSVAAVRPTLRSTLAVYLPRDRQEET